TVACGPTKITLFSELTLFIKSSMCTACPKSGLVAVTPNATYSLEALFKTSFSYSFFPVKSSTSGSYPCCLNILATYNNPRGTIALSDNRYGDGGVIKSTFFNVSQQSVR